MSNETTVQTQRKDEADLAPASPSQTMARAGEHTPASVPATTQQFIDPESRKGSKTMGEHLFNATTYGGFALVGNEITATTIVNQKDKANVIGRAYRAGDKFFAELGPKGRLPYIQQRMNYISFAIIGGMLMVPFIKWLEDNKSSLVRFADRILHGKKSETDPEIVAAHDEMDKAPRQSWGSLWKGRLLTVGAAYTVDSTIGWENGITARAFRGTKFEKYSSFDHVSNTVADKIAPRIAKLGNWDVPTTNKTLRTGLGLLTLSSALTLLFYTSSKTFARWRAKDEQPQLPAQPDMRGTEPVAHLVPHTPEDPREPRHHVSDASLAGRMQPEQAKQAMAGVS